MTEAIASSVEDNRSWHGHWLQFASNVLTIPGKTAKSRYFPALAKKKVHDLFPVRLEDTLNDKAKTADLFCSCKSVFVVEGSLSQVEASDQELEGKEVVICVNPKYPEVTTDRAESFELRCLVSGNLDNRQMFVRHKGQKFWVQNGALHLCRYEGADLHDGAYLGARIAVFCPRRSVGKLTSLKRRYLAAIGGQRCVHCDVHKCPLVLNHHHKKSSENTYKCVCREGWQHNRDEVCGQFGSYLCPYLDCCNISICDNHLSKSRNRCNSVGPEAAMFLSEVGSSFFSNDGVSDDGAFRGRCESSIANHVLPEALGPTAGHELPQDIVGEYGANCIMEDNSDSGSSFGSYDMVAEDNLEEPWNFVAAPTNDEDQQRVVVGDQEHNNSVNRSHVSEHFGAEDIPTTTIPTTTTGTDQCEIAVEHSDSSEFRIPLYVILNQHGHLLTRTNHKLRMNKMHWSITERLVAKAESKVSPLVYAKGQLFPTIFWYSLDDGSIPGAMPTALWSNKQTLKKLGIGSMRDHAKMRVSNPAIPTSVDPAYHFMLLDQLTNLGANGKHTRLVLQRGFCDHQQNDGVSFRDRSDSAELYGDTSENHANVHKLAALVEERRPHYFFTQTCNQKTCSGLRVVREWLISKEAVMLICAKYGLDMDEASQYLRESAALYVSRSWNKVADMWM
ncbi:unnamed protein product [Cylindrotheca closterium]|uniref:Uncharacterized protein n=1 Tax=Cylindrotheca closterium TaxID=2856 RepID=A0AAD2G8W6_9STRA|nr:unnamed protein product [Cylindrotheca closterium]